MRDVQFDMQHETGSMSDYLTLVSAAPSVAAVGSAEVKRYLSKRPAEEAADVVTDVMGMFSFWLSYCFGCCCCCCCCTSTTCSPSSSIVTTSVGVG